MEFVHDSRDGYEHEVELEITGRKKVKERKLNIPIEILERLERLEDDLVFFRVCQSKKEPDKKFIIVYFRAGDYSEKE